MNQERDKLNIQQNFAQFAVHDGLNYEPVQLRSCRNGNTFFESSDYCSEMLCFLANSQALMGHKDDIIVQEPNSRVGEASLVNFSHAMSSMSCDPQGISIWKDSASQSSSDWTADPCPALVGNLSGPLKMIQTDYQVSHSSLINSTGDISTQNGQKLYGDLHCNSSLYQSAVQDVNLDNCRTTGLKLASFRQNNDQESSQAAWAVGGSELLLLPAYADQLCLKSGVDWYGELECGENKNIDRDQPTTANVNSNSQALSLSLSSVPSPKLHMEQAVEIDISADSHCRNVNNVRNSEALKSTYLSSNPIISFDSKISESSPQSMVGNSTFAHRIPGPLGPFTGYATILRSSKFLKPAQQLMDELCCGENSKYIEMHNVSSEKTHEEIGVSGDGICSLGPVLKVIPGDSGCLSFTFHSSIGKSQEPGGTSSSMNSHWPQYLQKKAKLLYMKDEVCKWYTQYHQQMQMVVSSFESVAGLSAATPYISIGLKTVSRHLRCLKNVIADQLRSVSNAFGEDLSSPTAGTSGSKGDKSGSTLKFLDKSFQKQNGWCYTGFIEPQQHVWRPQRGLPERAVSVLRAWLFDHFLHPYPTDTDKHMLAARTGLTRNQVSNWFINARVRVWKPMVEEIHMLETKGITETGSSTSKSDGKSLTPTEGSTQLNGIQSFNTRGVTAVSDTQMDCLTISPSDCQGDAGLSADLWNHKKRSRLEYHIPDSMEGSFMGFVPCHRGGLEIGGLGAAVSLTLGLRQSVGEFTTTGPEDRPNLHIGGQIIHDFVG